MVVHHADGLRLIGPVTQEVATALDMLVSLICTDNGKFNPKG